MLANKANQQSLQVFKMAQNKTFLPMQFYQILFYYIHDTLYIHHILLCTLSLYIYLSVLSVHSLCLLFHYVFS